MVSAGFVHLLGTAIKELNPHLKFPLAPFLCGLGFLVTLVADHIAEVLSHRNGWESPPGHCMPSTPRGEMTRLQHVLVVDPVTPGRNGEGPDFDELSLCPLAWRSETIVMQNFGTKPCAEEPPGNICTALRCSLLNFANVFGSNLDLDPHQEHCLVICTAVSTGGGFVGRDFC